MVVPVKDVPQPSGQSVTLQAMATGRAVVLSRTRGLWAPAELRDGGNVMLVPPADPVELAHTVNLLLDDRARATALGEAAQGERPARCHDGAIRGTVARSVSTSVGGRLMSFRTKPRAAMVHTRRLLRPARTYVDWMSSRRDGADLSVFHEYVPPPSGGGHQFIRALSRELAAPRADSRIEPHLGVDEDVPLQLVQLRRSRLRRFARDDVRMVHRVDGPIGVYRGFDDGTDG